MKTQLDRIGKSLVLTFSIFCSLNAFAQSAQFEIHNARSISTESQFKKDQSKSDGNELEDPCSCLNNSTPLNLNTNTGGDDGTFSEVVAITGPGGGPIADATLVFEVAAQTGVLDAFNVPTVGNTSPLVSVAIGTQMSYNATTMHYEIPFVHTEENGYTISIQQIVAGVPGQILGPIGNICKYPKPVFQPMILDSYTTLDPAVTLGAMDPGGLGSDAVNFTLNMGAVTELDPNLLGPGTHNISLTWDGAADANGGISPNGGTTPAEPGCIQEVTKAFEITPGIPSMGQWGLFILALFISITALVYIKQREMIEA